MKAPQDILVLGLGASGRAVATYCARRVPERFSTVTVLDSSDTPALRAVAEQLGSVGVDVRLGVSQPEGRFDLCVASPGIAPHTELMGAARTVSSRCISEIQFAFEESSSAWIAITGTNGKTTTTALVAHLLASAGMPVRAVGNIGSPAIEAVGEGEGEGVLVAEVSSFQLALTTTFRPRVSVLLNITPDHADWHGTFEDYSRDKARVFANQGPGDVAVIDVDDQESAPYADALLEQGVQVVRVSRRTEHAGGATCDGGVLTLLTPAGPLRLCHEDELLIRGPHNVSNALAAAAAAHSVGVNSSDLRAGLMAFRPIEHRLEPAGVAGGAEWFNDSKATNPDAVLKALGAFGDRPLVVLLGGRNKGSDFRVLAAETARRAKAVVLFGEAQDELSLAFAGVPVTQVRCAGLAAAVDEAAKIAAQGDSVLLSPGCASFDEFANYEERGRTFKRLVGELAEGESLR